MTEQERIAEKVILFAYENGCQIVDDLIKNYLTKEEYEIYENDDTTTYKLLLVYGEFGFAFSYKLNKEGIEFAQTGCYSGRAKREKQDNKRANIALIFSGLAILIALIALMNDLCK
jgi:hypothetical protein